MSASTILAAIAAVLIGAVTAFNSWQTRRSLARFKANNDQLRAELEAANGRAAVSDATATATTEQAGRTAAGQLDAKEIRDVPITGDPSGDRAALYERDRVLRTGQDGDR